MSESDRPILLVEDTSDDAELALLALQRANVTVPVEVVQDGVQAMKYLFGDSPDEPPPPLPRLVLLDIKLPKIDGFQVLQRMRQHPRTKRVPIVILSSSDLHSDIARAHELGANSFVRKPVDFERYADAVGAIGHYWIHINQSLESSRKEDDSWQSR